MLHSLKISFVLAKSTIKDEMVHQPVVFHMGLYCNCLLKYQLMALRLQRVNCLFFKIQARICRLKYVLKRPKIS